MSNHRITLHRIIVAVALKLARTLLERLRKTSWNIKTQFTHVSRHPGAWNQKNKYKNLGKTDYIIWSQILERNGVNVHQKLKKKK